MYRDVATHTGALGLELDWPLLMSVIIITLNVWGFAAGEWIDGGSQPKRIVIGGIGGLISGFFALAYASR